MPRKKLRVGVCQMQAGENVEQNAARVVERLKSCASRKVDVVAFQEGVLYGYSCRKEFWDSLDPRRLVRAERRILRACKRYGVAAVVGSSHVEGEVRYNSLLVVGPDGSLVGRYGKIHLAGEKWCAPSQHLPLYRVCGVPSCFLICHDVRYPELVRLPAAAGAQVCYFCSCESPVTAEWKLSAYRAMPISRATENSIYVVMANAPADPDDINRSGSSHGQSKVIHPDGNVVTEAGMFTEDVLVCDLELAAADRGMARRAVNDRTPVRDWMRSGVEVVERNAG